MEWMGLPGSFIPEVALSAPASTKSAALDADLYEYLLVIQPGGEVYNKITEEKEHFFQEYQGRVSIKTKPHISIAGFLAKESMEATLIRWIQRICSLRTSFTVTLNNYSGFPPHTIYLRVMDPEPFQQLARELLVIDEFVRSNGFPRVQLVSKPHLTIARRLKEEVYEKAMMDYAARSFCESFVAEELVLLKRKGPYDKCKLVNVFGLLPSQHKLFN